MTNKDQPEAAMRTLAIASGAHATPSGATICHRLPCLAHQAVLEELSDVPTALFPSTVVTRRMAKWNEPAGAHHRRLTRQRQGVPSQD